MTATRRTTFTVVPPRARPRRRRIVALLVALLAIAGLAAAAGALTVGVREEAASIFAERIEIGDRFFIGEATLSAVAADATALGTLAAPVELAAPASEARTALQRDHWAYTVLVKESSADAVGGGAYVISVFLDGAPLGTVHAQQENADAAAAEGIRATFDVGTQLRPSSLYYIVVQAIVENAPTVSHTVRSNPNGNLTWVGDGGDVDGQVNPTLRVGPATILHLRGVNGDGLTHNIGIRGADGTTVVAPPGWSSDFDAAGEEATISWTTQAGTYSYACRYHPTMTGALIVE